MDLAALVQSQLGSRIKPSDRSRPAAFITCPFHKGGQERTPSCKVNLRYGRFPPGHFKCFGCGESGNWAKLAHAIGLKSDAVDGVYRARASANLRRNATATIKSELKLGKWPSHIAWRSIPGAVVRKLHGQVVKDEYGREKLYLPCNMFGEEIGGINCLIHRRSKQQLAYFNLPGEWAHDALLFFDEIAALESPYIGIVEGPRDAARMVQYGIPSVGMIGTGNAIHSSKWENFLSLAPKLAIIATDDDEAGKEAAIKIKRHLRRSVEIMRVQFRNGDDPGKVAGTKLQRLALVAAQRCGLTEPKYLIHPSKYLKLGGAVR